MPIHFPTTVCLIALYSLNVFSVIKKNQLLIVVYTWQSETLIYILGCHRLYMLLLHSKMQTKRMSKHGQQVAVSYWSIILHPTADTQALSAIPTITVKKRTCRQTIILRPHVTVLLQDWIKPQKTTICKENSLSCGKYTELCLGVWVVKAEAVEIWWLWNLKWPSDPWSSAQVMNWYK